MRTTLTIDDDVAAELAKLRRTADLPLKQLVNEALRRGLREMDRRPKARKPFRTRTFDMGEPLIDLDNIAEALDYLERKDSK
jgi:Arc/MetJ family transcription regulator